MKEEFSLLNDMAVPKIKKVVVNMGIADAKDNAGVLDKAKINLASISGQQPVVTRAKKSIAAFKLAEGNPIGLKVTLRGSKMYIFLDKLISVVLPKVRDFRGVSVDGFDSQGNYNLGLREQIIFPEVDYKNVDKPRGIQITITTSAPDREQGKRLLELVGLPFVK